MELTPDTIVLFQIGRFGVNATIVNTWIIMAVLAGGAALLTRRLKPNVPPDRWRTTLEVIVQTIESQIGEIAKGPTQHILYFSGTLFLFILVANLMTVIPGFHTPTASLSTTTALALAVLIAVPLFGISRKGIKSYLKSYAEPTLIMLPFNVISELSRGISLAIRLYGNIMSGAVIVAILLSIAPFFFPVLMDMLGLLTGVIQAYIFAILATVYIASATDSSDTKTSPELPEELT
jgi:F-type H+-transporting ATPase subunit a